MENIGSPQIKDVIPNYRHDAAIDNIGNYAPKKDLTKSTGAANVIENRENILASILDALSVQVKATIKNPFAGQKNCCNLLPEAEFNKVKQACLNDRYLNKFDDKSISFAASMLLDKECENIRHDLYVKNARF